MLNLPKHENIIDTQEIYAWIDKNKQNKYIAYFAIVMDKCDRSFDTYISENTPIKAE